jgi:nucleotide-binding universal stress UspA family protein
VKEIPMQIQKILVPVDFSSCSTAALRFAVNLASKLEATIEVLHVLELPHYVIPDVMVEVPGERKQTLTEFARSEASKDLQQMLDELEAQGHRIKSRLKAGYPRDEILAAAEEDRVDLIVMGTHGRTGISHLFLGSVAEQVVRRAHCPVMTIRVTEDEEETPEVP